MEKYNNTIIIWMQDLNEIGGIETWIYNMCINLNVYCDITILFKDANIEQLKKLNKVANIEMIENSIKYKSDICIIASAWGKLPSNIESDRYIQMIHSDYKYLCDNTNWEFKLEDKITDIVSVSDIAKNGLYSKYGIKSDVLYNLLEPKKKQHKKILHLSTFSRLSEEKGHDNIKRFAEGLISNNIPFDWKIFSNDNIYKIKRINLPQIIYMPTVQNSIDYMIDSDYVVQLSKSESYCMSIHEALYNNVPVIVSNIEAFTKYVKNGINGYILPNNYNEINYNDIYTSIPNISDLDYKPDGDVNAWVDYLHLDKGMYKKRACLNNETVIVRALCSFTDSNRGIYHKCNDEWKEEKLRAYELSSYQNKAGMKLCSIVR